MQRPEEEEQKTVQLPGWALSSILLVVFIVVIFGIGLTIYRYSLIGRAIGKGETGTAVALAAPEIGTGLGTFTSGLFAPLKK